MSEFEYVTAKTDLKAHQDFLLDLIAQGEDAWNTWRKDNDLESLDFSGVEFADGFNFSRFEFGDNIKFNKATFGKNISFVEATFGNYIGFYKATFGNRIRFDDATFGKNISFVEATFGMLISFDEAAFGSDIRFDKATFGSDISFDEATFGNQISFVESTFGSDISFDEATFGNRISFAEATFGNQISFAEATFGNRIKFNQAKFGIYSIFNEASFGMKCNFSHLRIEGRIIFNDTRFDDIPIFMVRSEDDKIKISMVNMSIRLNRGYIDSRTNFFSSSDSSSYIEYLQNLKGIADATRAVNESRDWFILQRKAERINQWNKSLRLPFKLSNLKSAPLLKSTMATIFWILSDYGRSVVRPTVWLMGSVPAFYHLYRFLYPGKLIWVAQKDALLDYTLSSSIPFGRLLNPAFDRAFQVLFPLDNTGKYPTVDISIGFQVASMAQGLVSIVLIFLIGLSIRNYFKIS